MKTEILMPSLSPTMEEGSLAKWYVRPGDKVKPGDIIADIETDKALMEYESIEEGTILDLLVTEGTENIKVFWDSFLCQKSEGDELLISNLTDKLFPLINYSTGDIITSERKSSILSFDKIVGRSNDFITILLKNEKKHIHGEFFTHILKSISSILDFQIKQKRDLSIQISYTCINPKKIDHIFFTEATKEYKDIHLDQFSFLQVDAIPRTLSGKAKWIEVEK